MALRQQTKGGRTSKDKAEAALRDPVRREWEPAERRLKRSTRSRLGGDNWGASPKHDGPAGQASNNSAQKTLAGSDEAQTPSLDEAQRKRGALCRARRLEREEKRQGVIISRRFRFVYLDRDKCTHIRRCRDLQRLLMHKNKQNQRATVGASLPVPTSDICEAARSQTARKCWREMRRTTVR